MKRIINILGLPILILAIILISAFALSVCFDSCNARIAERQKQWRERVEGGTIQDIPSPPPKRTESMSIGRVSKGD